MTTLENYEHRFGIAGLTADEILKHVENAEANMARCTSLGLRTTSAGDDRVLVWPSGRLQAVYAALEGRGVPVAARCAWCFRAGPQTDEAWGELPKMTLDDAAIHSQVCEHNPLVQQIRRLTALLDGFVHGEVAP